MAANSKPRHNPAHGALYLLASTFSLILGCAALNKSPFEKYLHACNSENHPIGCKRAAEHYEDDGDLKSALKYHKRACDLAWKQHTNSGGACEYAAELFEGQNNSSAAFEYYMKACEIGGINHEKKCKIAIEKAPTEKDKERARQYWKKDQAGKVEKNKARATYDACSRACRSHLEKCMNRAGCPLDQPMANCPVCYDKALFCQEVCDKNHRP